MTTHLIASWVGRGGPAVVAGERPGWWLALLIVALVACGMGLAACGEGERTGSIVAVRSAEGDEPISGRLIVFAIHESADLPADTPPGDGPFWDDPQPIFGQPVDALDPGGEVELVPGADAFPVPLRSVEPGRYRVQAVLIRERVDSDWRRSPGTLYSDPVEATLPPEPDAPLRLSLSNTVEPRELEAITREGDVPSFEEVTLASTLLERFGRRGAVHRAGVVFPTDYDPDRRYPALFIVPGFGGDHATARAMAEARDLGELTDAEARLHRACFVIVLNPESPNGHTLFADSRNNGPVGEALVREFIPHLQQEYNLIPAREARMLRGHSSGGWSVLWLATTYPDTFGAAWSTAPDPVDFRRFQIVNIYEDKSMFQMEGDTLREREGERAAEAPPPVRGETAMPYPEDGPPPGTGSDTGMTERPSRRSTPDAASLVETPSYRVGDEVRMTIREEVAMEEVMGPRATSGQQWASWQAVFGPRDPGGRPSPLFNPRTGEISSRVVSYYQEYDLRLRLSRDPGRLAPIYLERIRILMGDRDNYDLDGAVRLLREELREHARDPSHIDEASTASSGYIKMLSGEDHSSVLKTEEARAIPEQMLRHLRRSGVIQ